MNKPYLWKFTRTFLMVSGFLSMASSVGASAPICSHFFAGDGSDVVQDRVARDFVLNAIDPLESSALFMAGGGGPDTRDVKQRIRQALSSSVVPLEISFPGSSPWIRDWWPLLIKDRSGLRQIVFRPLSAEEASWQSSRILEEFGIPATRVDLNIDIGNLVSDGTRVFVSASKPLLSSNRIRLPDIKARLEAALDLEVIFIPELPNEMTGHADMMLQYMGGNRWVVADSYYAEQKSALDETAEILKRFGAEVHRIKNAQFGRATLAYVNSLRINQTIYMPVFGRSAGQMLNEIIFDAGYMQLLRSGSTFAQNGTPTTFKHDDMVAAQAYRDLGFEVVPISVGNLANAGGCLHCIGRPISSEVMSALPAESFRRLTRRLN